ncbi:tetratricopeptide repeat protein [Chryseobacterium wangxinyae]|uniref:tetratricopeptide repeat protein n=1 Tax=Chryseobacterium sp. CY353 TaxID=2997334 RepID=UPI00226D6ABF|nr:tetratricopeptide repeat protein [Chryseobacterium sp. CY353]MCY0969997.1 tetratricopeptide repeat protein [Chryseobacterium sp. CY353]
MNKKLIFCIIILAFNHISAQKKTFKCEKVHDAVKLIDAEKYDEAIQMLRECEKIDPKEYTYPYEIALAYTYNKQYSNAVDQLLKIKNYDDLGADYYQILGNNYDYLGKPETAIATYDEGLKKFPNAGRLYLERGVIFEFEKKYDDAIKSYENGMRVNPNYPSNYYRAGRLFMNSQNTVKGLIYGEIFVNLERTTERTREISKMLFDTYKNAIKFENNEKRQVAFCKSVNINISDVDKKKLPYCMIFEKNMIFSVMEQNNFTLSSFAKIRQRFLKEYYLKDYQVYPNLLFDYQKKMNENEVFNAYNHYLFQVGDEEGFKTWQTANRSEYEKFVDWYTSSENSLNLDQKGVSISDQIK